MARFVVLIIGRRIYLPTEENQDSINGFVTLRLQTAKNEKQAVQMAKRNVFSEWNDFYNRDNRAGVPELSVGLIKRLYNPFFLRKVDSGYVFFSDDLQERAYRQDRISFTSSRWCF